MAVLTVTGSQVVIGGTGATYEEMVAHEALAVGDFVYKDSDGEAAKADNSSATKAAVYGLVVASAAAAGQKCVVQKTGEPTLGAGAGPAQGTVYFISATAGKVCPAADVTSGLYVTAVCVGSGTNKVKLWNKAAAVAVP